MWSFEWWKSFFEVGGVVLLFLTFAFGAGFFLTGRVVSRRQEVQLRRFDRELTLAKTAQAVQEERAAKMEAGNIQLRADLENATAESTRRQKELEIEQRKTAEAQRAAAVAQLELKKHIEQVAEPRRIIDPRGDRNGDRNVRNELFNGVKKYAATSALIQCVPSDFEALTLARDIGFALVTSGWNVSFTDELHSKIPAGYVLPGVHLVTLEESPFKYGPSPEVRLLPVQPSPSFHAAVALRNLLVLDLGPNKDHPSLFGVDVGQELNDEHTKMLTLHGFAFPPGAVVILVGQKPAAPFFVPEPSVK